MSQADPAPGGLPGVGGKLAAKNIREHWVLFLIEGIALLILGAAAIVLPTIASLAATIFFGWLLVIGGIVGLVASFAARNAPGMIWGIISGLVALVAGGLLLFWPIAGMLSLTLVLAAFLVVDGVVSILYGLEHRRHGSQRWVWVLVNGVMDLLLAALILWWLPASAAWILGLVLGIDLVFAGTSLVAMALAARGATPA